jgi:hypothetical protein
MGFDGTDWERIRVTNTGQAHVAVQNTVTVTGTITVGTLPNEGQQSMANSISVAIASDQSAVPVSQATASNLNAQVVGAAAHDAAVSGNPVAVAARANLDEPTAVANGDATHLWADRFGRLVVLRGHGDPEQPVQFPLTASGETAVTEIGAPGASTSNCICRGSVHNSGSSPITVQLKDGTGGTVVWEAELAADGGGSLFDFGDRGWQMTANTGLYANLSGAGTVSLNVTQWYIAATQT